MNISEQRSAFINTLFEIKFALNESSLRADDYQSHLNSALKDGSCTDLLQRYTDALKALLQEILHFQAKSICFLFSPGWERHLRNASKWNNWNGMLAAIQKRLGVVRGFDGLLQSSLRFQELERQSRMQTVVREQLREISEQLSSLQVHTQNENRRRELFEWLNTPSCRDDYNRLRDNHQTSTSAWLLRDGAHVTKWRQAPNSFMWIHGESNHPLPAPGMP